MLGLAFPPGPAFPVGNREAANDYTVKKGKTYRYYTPIKHRCFGAWASQHGPLPAEPATDGLGGSAGGGGGARCLTGRLS